MNKVPKRLFSLNRPRCKEYQIIEDLMARFTPKIYKDVNPLENFRVLMKDCGVSMERLNSLNIIHVAGTKGKGSTCAFIECILRHHNYKTGFYSSPQIRFVNDRVKINSEPIPVETYLKHLQFVCDQIKSPLPSVGREGVDVHTRGAILTVVAILSFLEEKVDVAILETILGGRYDDTNVATKPIICGITQIDFDHCNFLSNDLKRIAWFKAGIMKENVPVFVQNQSNEVLNVFKSNAKGGNSPFAIAPELESYTAKEDIKLGLSGNFQRPNASLALQISKAWMARMNGAGAGGSYSTEKPPNEILPPFYLSNEYLQGLSTCSWPCRAQIMTKENITYFMEGAHTPMSCQYAAEWYKESVAKVKPVKRILLFASKSSKDALINFQPFNELPFDDIVLCVDYDKRVYKYEKRIENMNKLFQSLKSEDERKVVFFKTFPEAFSYIENCCDGINGVITIFVTGSLSLCANVLNGIEHL